MHVNHLFIQYISNFCKGDGRPSKLRNVKSLHEKIQFCCGGGEGVI